MRDGAGYPFFLGLAAGMGLMLMLLVLPGALLNWLVSGGSNAAITAESAALIRPVRGAPATVEPPPTLVALATPTPTVPPTSTPTPQPTPQATASRSTPQPTPGARVRVAHTDGKGVVLRSAPADAARMPAGFLEGQVLTVLQREGTQWVRVRSDSGLEGWIPAAYLEPAG